VKGDPLLYAIESYEPLAEAIIREGGFERGTVNRKRFADGEYYQRIAGDPGGRDVVLVGGTSSDRDTLELYDMACGLVYYGARRLTLVIPFFGYSTMERAVREGEVVVAKNRARLLSSIPAASMGVHALLFDLHVAGITHYFEGDVHPVHVYGKAIIAEAARDLGGDDFVLACTDAGRAKWVESLANDLGVTAAFVYKRRLENDSTEVTGVSALVENKKVIIYDDMIRSGGSMLGAARAYHDAGAASVAAICTHGIFPGNALSELEQSGLFTGIVCTDSHPRARSLASPFLEVRSTAPLFAEHIRRIP
jgi:ribose-phosphate pyrophosphokinase